MEDAFSPEDKKVHLKFLKSCYDVLPSAYQGQDSNRITVCYFTLAALDLFGELDGVVDKEKTIDWVYSLQIQPSEGTNLDGTPPLSYG